MHKAESAKVQFSWSLLGSAVLAACQFGVLVTIARLQGPAGVGIFTLSFALISPVFVFASLNLRPIVVTDVRGDFSPAVYMRLRILATLAAVVCIAAWLIFAPHKSVTPLMAWMICVVKSAETMSDMLHARWQKQANSRQVAISLVVRGFGMLILTGATLALTHDLATAMTAYALAHVACLVFIDFRHSTRPVFGPATWQEVVSLFRRAVPYGLGTFAGSFMFFLPQYAIELQFGGEVLGVFGALIYFLAINSVIIAAVGQTASTRLARLLDSDVRQFKRATHQLALGGLVMGLLAAGLAIAIGEPLLKFIFGEHFSGHASILAALALVAAVTNVQIAYGTALAAARRFGAHLPGNILQLGVLTAGLVVFKDAGLIGVTYAMITANVALFIYYAVIFQRQIRLSKGARTPRI